MRFATPSAFWLLAAIPLLLLLWVAAGNRSRRMVRQIVALRLEGMLVGEAVGRAVRFALLLAGSALAIVALARPQWGEMSEDRKGRGRDVIIVVDVSRSMLATDLPPSRLQRAKLAAEDLVRQMPSDRVGLVAFAGSAFLQAPVTADHNAVITAIHELDPEIIPLQGTNLSGALQCADDAFDRSEGGQRAIVLITDGEELEADAVTLAKELSAKMRIFTVGVGSAEGAVLMVPSPRGGMEYVRDAEGNMVHSKLDESRLIQIAEAGGGFYTHLVSGPKEMQKIAQEGIDTMEEHDVLLQAQTHAVDRFQWPLGLALLLLGTGFCVGEGSKRKAAGVLVAGIFFCGFPSGATAASQGRILYDAGNYSGAQEAFGDELKNDPGSPHRAFNLGVAAYKNQKWAEAIDAFGKALVSKDPQLRSRAEYNLANTLVQQARQGRRGQDNETLEQAIGHYEEAFRRDPDFEDAKFNRDFVKRLLEKKKEQQQQQKDKDDKKDKNEKDQDKDDNKKDGQGQEQDGKEDSKQSEDQKGGQGGDKEESKRDGKNQGKEGSQGSNSNQSDSKDQQSAGNQPPQPVEEKPGEQKERGELKDSPTVNKPEGGEDGKKSDKEAQVAKGGDGKMTREQAAALMEALRSEDRRVQIWAPNKPDGPAAAKAGKTW